MTAQKFALNPDCFLVKGAKRGALYNLKDETVYSINENSVHLFEDLENGKSLAQIIDRMKADPDEVMQYLEELESSGLGRFIGKDDFVEKIFLPLPENKLNFIWMELTQRCNLKCVHCYVEGEIDKKTGVLSPESSQTIIKDAFQLGCRKIQLIGGEPFLYGKDIFLLIKLAKELGYEMVEVFTNATLLTQNDIDQLSYYGVRMAISVYSVRPEIHDCITRQKGSFDLTIENIKKLADRGVELRFALIATRENQKYLKETIDFLKKWGGVDPFKCVDVVRSVGRGKNGNLLSDELKSWSTRKSPYFLGVNKEDFSKRKYGHCCWWGRIAVTSDGEVIPCIMARNRAVGSIKKNSLSEIIEEHELMNLWKLSMDKIEICKDCEYRYACHDCRVSAEESGGLRARTPNCLYDPYCGKWQSL